MEKINTFTLLLLYFDPSSTIIYVSDPKLEFYVPAFQGREPDKPLHGYTHPLEGVAFQNKSPVVTDLSGQLYSQGPWCVGLCFLELSCWVNFPVRREIHLELP